MDIVLSKERSNGGSMGRKTIPQPRAGLKGSRGYTIGLGARHPVVDSDTVGDFFYELDMRWSTILPERSELECQLFPGSRESRFKVLDDGKKMGITVLERRVVTNYMDRRRKAWQPNDIGRVRGRIMDSLGSMMGTSIGGNRQITFTSAVRVGAENRKIALVPEQNSDAYAFLVDEHGIVLGGLRRELPGLEPYGPYTPKMTVGHVYRGAAPEKVDACVESLNELVGRNPLTVALEPLVLFSR